MNKSTSVQVGLPGMGKEEAQSEMFGEVSGKESGKVNITEVPLRYQIKGERGNDIR